MSFDLINVGVGEMKKAENPDMLEANFGPCTVIAIYDPDTKSGYMIHEANIQDVNLNIMIGTIKADYGDLSRLKVFVAGASFIYGTFTFKEAKVEREILKRDRIYVEGILKKYFKKSQVEYHWLPDEHGATLHLHTSTGKFEFEVEELEH
tara:strand:+ start:537 stop:986 length:450 start_codon:yes stop_codon:yes gene_type:complete